MTRAARTFGKPGARALTQAAEVAVRDCLGIAAGERVAIVTNPDAAVSGVARAVHDAAAARDADVVMVVQAPRGPADMADPAVIALLETDPSVVITLTNGPLGGDPARIARPIHDAYPHYVQYLIGEGVARGFWSPGIDARLFARTVNVDHAAIEAEATALADLLADAAELHVDAPGGTRIVVPVDGARVRAETGLYRQPGSGGNLPAGELVIPVAEGKAEGHLAIDGTLSLPDGPLRPREPVTAQVEEGRTTRVAGGDAAAALQQAFADGQKAADRAVTNGWLTRAQAKVYAAAAHRVAEVGIGLNPAARETGLPLVDEKVRGAVYVGLGAASHETPPGAPVSIHGLLRRASVRVTLSDGTEVPLVEKGTPCAAVPAR